MTTEIQWGDPIAVNGKRPAWLGDDGSVLVWNAERIPSTPGSGPAGYDWDEIKDIRLPAGHFAYRAIAAGMEPWGGGDAAPADRSSDALLRSGKVIGIPAFWGWSTLKPENDVIGYRKRAPTFEDHLSAPVFGTEDVTWRWIAPMPDPMRERVNESQVRNAEISAAAGKLAGRRWPQATPAPDTVTIRRMTEAEAMALARDVAGALSVDDVVPPSRIVGAHAMLKHLGIIKPEPGPAEQCAAALGISIETAEKVLDWWAKHNA